MTAFEVYDFEEEGSCGGLIGVGLMNRVLKIFSLEQLFHYKEIGKKKFEEASFEMVFHSIVVGL